jgi:uncharacterized iron-regulated membrane protein
MLRTRYWLRQVHIWLGLILGLQVCAWLLSGLVMSLIPIEQVRGSAWVHQADEALGPHLPEFRVTPGAISGGLPADASVVAALRAGEPIYLVQQGRSTLRAISALDGHEMPALDGAQAEAIARAAHTDHPAVVQSVEVASPEGEARGLGGPVWRVSLADRWSSNVYVDPVSGRVLSVRNDLWRFYDFFWMLHIMDYRDREDINTPLLRAVSVWSTFLGLSGLWLLVYSFGGRYTHPPQERRSP